MYQEAEYHPREAFIVALVRGVIAPLSCRVVLVAMYDVLGVWLSSMAAEILSFVVACLIVIRQRHFIKMGEV